MTQHDNFVLLHITAWGWSGCWHLQVGGWTTRGHAKFYWKQVTIIRHCEWFWQAPNDRIATVRAVRKTTPSRTEMQFVLFSHLSISHPFTTKIFQDYFFCSHQTWLHPGEYKSYFSVLNEIKGERIDDFIAIHSPKRIASSNSSIQHQFTM